MEYDPTTAETMIAAAFAGSERTLSPDPDFGRLLELAESARYRYAWDQMAPLVPRLTVPEVLGLAVELVGSVVLTERAVLTEADDAREASRACRRALKLFDSLKAEGFSAREIAHVSAGLLAGVVLMFPA